jgi:demethylmenaquinone methyltransferase/2-methoxy-6-polyprenyl-1,4-benzoquinol methylase
MFDRIAPRYDLLNRVLSAGIDVRWRREAVDLLELEAGARVLDLCAGTADVLIEALARPAAARGWGVDISEAMLRLGSRKLREQGLGERAALSLADAESLPLASSSFDAAIVAFGIRNVSNPVRALAEMRRVLRPGGRVVVLEFSMPHGLLGRVYRFYFRRLLPAVGGLVSGDGGAYAYLPASVERFAGPAEMQSLLAQTGFGSVSARPLTGGIAHLYRALAGKGPVVDTPGRGGGE